MLQVLNKKKGRKSLLVSHYTYCLFGCSGRKCGNRHTHVVRTAHAYFVFGEICIEPMLPMFVGRICYRRLRFLRRSW